MGNDGDRVSHLPDRTWGGISDGMGEVSSIMMAFILGLGVGIAVSHPEEAVAVMSSLLTLAHQLGHQALVSLQSLATK